MPRYFAAALLAAFLFSLPARAAEPDPSRWDAVLAEARGQTVYFNAWGGGEQINAYIEWAAGELDRAPRHQAGACQAGRHRQCGRPGGGREGGRQGQRRHGRPHLDQWREFRCDEAAGPAVPPGWAEKLPNWRFVDVEDKPTVRTDFTVPVEGLGGPWGMAKMVFFYDEARTAGRTAALGQALLDWAKANPGRFTYPQPPDFIGSSFLKQVLVELAADPAVLRQAGRRGDVRGDDRAAVRLARRAQPADLWRGRQGLSAELSGDEAAAGRRRDRHRLRLQPREASSAIAAGELPDTVRSFVFPAARSATRISLPFPTMPPPRRRRW